MQTNTNSPLRHVSFVENEVKLSKNRLKKIPASRRIPSSSSNNNISKRKSILLINKYNDDQEDYSDDEEVTVKKTSWIKRLFQCKKKKTTVIVAPTIKKEAAEEEKTISESTQKAIYELSRLKLTNPKRPLRHQVVVTNFLLQCT